MWFTTSQRAFWPHVPGQGSTHLLFTQALSRAQSELRTHSGRQPTYGSPKYSGKHEQVPSLHWVLDPHGDGLQGSVTTGLGAARNISIAYYEIEKKEYWVSWGTRT